jgi:hypothetical protein
MNRTSGAGKRAPTRQLQRLSWHAGSTAPVIHHDHGFLDDGKGNLDLKKMRAPTSDDINKKRWWEAKLIGAEMLRQDLYDATLAYDHFLRATGTDLTVNYEAYVRDDPSGQTLLQSAIEDAKSGARIQDNAWISANSPGTGAVPHHEHTFSSDGIPVGGTTRFPYPKTEDWQKAIGAHVIWLEVHVASRVDSSGRRFFTITLTIHMEDRYNFNPGAKDIATGTPDSDNGIFEITGLAKEFMQYGTATRTIIFDEPVSTAPNAPSNDTVTGEKRKPPPTPPVTIGGGM